jgi:4-hydroxy-tetrahydrodipicolinate reductase
MQAIRGGDVVGDHTVHFLGLNECIEITHRVSLREVFARAAVRAGYGRNTPRLGLYGMGDVLSLR